MRAIDRRLATDPNGLEVYRPRRVPLPSATFERALICHPIVLLSSCRLVQHRLCECASNAHNVAAVAMDTDFRYRRIRSSRAAIKWTVRLEINAGRAE